MKVLFAVNNESISETIIKKYQKMNGELLEYKNVYYYNAIVKEIQKEHDYDFIVISEDLETISSSDKSKIDVFVLDKLEKIMDVFKVEEIKPIPILFITNEKRNMKDEIIPNMFNLGIYNALVEKDRTITKICDLIKNPRTETEARAYYKLKDDDPLSMEKEVVNPKEINNILRHYKKILEMPDRFSSSFDRIVAQYDDVQLKYIIEKLPEEVTLVLENENAKYKEIIKMEIQEIVKEEPKTPSTPIVTPKTTGVVIPTEISKENIKSQTKVSPVEEEIDEIEIVEEEQQEQEELDIEMPTVDVKEDTSFSEIVIEGLEDDLDIFIDATEDDEDFIPIFGMDEIGVTEDVSAVEEIAEEVEETKDTEDIIIPEETTDIEISALDGEDIDIFVDEALIDEAEESIVEDHINLVEESIVEAEEPIVLKTSSTVEKPKIDIFADQEESIDKKLVSQDKKDFIAPDLTSVLSKDKKAVIFVGTSKNGTSFLVNSLGMMFASIGINTAILDMTQNRNSYYLSTRNDERLRQMAVESTVKLRDGIAMGVEVVKGLTVYTALPGIKDDFSDAETILSTLIKNYSLVLIDADFNTNFGYFSAAQEIYLVQSLDVLTIQPLTAFLKELLDAGILTTEKVKVVLNKEVAVRGLTRKLLVGGISTYNDPAMSIMTNLFDRNLVQVASIPFDQNVYSKYLENIVECKYDISGYPKKFVEALKILANMVYPLVSKQRDISQAGVSPNIPINQPKAEPFTNDMSSTLDQMRRKL